jgi:hypothetical protein
MFAPQTNPASPAVFTCRIPKKEFFLVLILGMFTIALSSFPGLPILLRRQHKAELRSYRLFDPSSRVGR